MDDLISEEREVGPFSEIAIGGIGHLTITMGDEEALTVEAASDILPQIITRVEGNRLVIRHELRPFGRLFGRAPEIRYHVTVRALDGIAVSGATTVTGSGLAAGTFELRISGAAKTKLNLTADRLETHISGAGRVALNGKTNSQRVAISGAATYQADELASRECRVTISGAGTARVQVEEKLTAAVSGVGQVLYAGNPVVKKQVSGIGEIGPISPDR